MVECRGESSGLAEGGGVASNFSGLRERARSGFRRRLRQLCADTNHNGGEGGLTSPARGPLGPALLKVGGLDGRLPPGVLLIVLGAQLADALDEGGGVEVGLGGHDVVVVGGVVVRTACERRLAGAAERGVFGLTVRF